MSRPSVLTTSFHAYGHHPQHHFEGVVHSGLTYRQSLPIRPPELPAGYNNQHTGHHGRTSTVRMSGPAYMPSDEELAHLQKLSNEYEPEPTGPLVGERQSSSAITTEYANADPVYRIKTAALPSKYAYFRTCRGDGHCGWRAIAFTYFEALLRVGDVNRFEDEEARLNSMNNLLDLAGFERDFYMDWAEDAWELLRKLANSLRAMDGAAPDILLQTFNDLSLSMSIITYFKLLTSAWVKSHPDDYRDFVPMGDIKTFCSNNFETAVCEIDNLGIAALSEAVVKPAGLGLEVWYLDRSPGEEINRSFFAQPTDHNHMPIANAPMLRLLYRPGHYDILYKVEDFPAPMQQQPVPAQAPLQVAIANGYDDFVPQAANMPDVMTLIPGMGMYPTGLGQRWPSVSYDFSPSPVSQSQITPVQPYAITPTPAAPVTSAHQDYVSPIHASHMSHHNPQSHHTVQLEAPPLTLPMLPTQQTTPSSMERAPPLSIERVGPFRPSMYELEPGFGSGQTHAIPFQTSIFRNSHFNTAHFLNPDFQPEEWSPDAEYSTSHRGRHKSTSQ